MVSFNKNRCKGCALCVDACPKNIIQLAKDEMNEKGFHPAVCIDQSACISCAFCAMVCPDVVITVKK
ncbi:MAG: 4Fe-4S binding protein [Clostridiales bacterium]|jgi:2-oxoglutarate ferredoxin oxidoreductase subunit delta|nr:4Fe-4S binding protein [Clostridiales bacterium]